MKIINFTPNPAVKVNGKNGAGNTEHGGGFAKILNGLSGPSATANPGKTVSLENVRASQIPSSVDLGMAGLLLGRLNSNIKASSPDVLNNVHKLDGLVQIYSK